MRITEGLGPEDTGKWGGCGLLGGVVAGSQFPWDEPTQPRSVAFWRLYDRRRGLARSLGRGQGAEED